MSGLGDRAVPLRAGLADALFGLASGLRFGDGLIRFLADSLPGFLVLDDPVPELGPDGAGVTAGGFCVGLSGLGLPGHGLGHLPGFLRSSLRLEPGVLLPRGCRLSAACRASSASCTCAWICAAAASGLTAVARASARCSVVSRSAAASCSARSRVPQAVRIAAATGVRSDWGSWSAGAAAVTRVLVRQAFSGLCTGWPGSSACSQYTGAGPLVPRRGAGGRAHPCRPRTPTGTAARWPLLRVPVTSSRSCLQSN